MSLAGPVPLDRPPATPPPATPGPGRTRVAGSVRHPSAILEPNPNDRFRLRQGRRPRLGRLGESPPRRSGRSLRRGRRRHHRLRPEPHPRRRRLELDQPAADGVRRDIAGREEFGALLSKSGIGPDTTIVLYGDNNNWFAAWAYWQLQALRRRNLRLLNGGRKFWLDNNLPLSTDVPAYAETGYELPEADFSLRAFRDDILPRVGDSSLALVDVRSPAEFNGEVIAPPGMTETAQRAGHIPGAASIPWAQQVREDGTFKSADELTALYAAKGISGDRDIVAYCRIGERSSLSWFVLHELLGFQRVRNYDGSWTEWGSMVGVPIEVTQRRGRLTILARARGAGATRRRFDSRRIKAPATRISSALPMWTPRRLRSSPPAARLRWAAARDGGMRCAAGMAVLAIVIGDPRRARAAGVAVRGRLARRVRRPGRMSYVPHLRIDHGGHWQMTTGSAHRPTYGGRGASRPDVSGTGGASDTRSKDTAPCTPPSSTSSTRCSRTRAAG